MDLGLAGRTALVTAASRGLGYAVADRLAREGARVAVSSRDDEAIQAAAARIGGEAFGHAADLTDGGAVEALMDVVLERFGRLDILVVNTGGPPTMEFLDATIEDWESALGMLFFPAVRMLRRALPGMIEARHGRVVFMTSTWVKQPRQRGVLSTAPRSALSGLSKHLANELGQHNVCVNQVMPGPIWGERSKQITARLSQARGVPVEDIKAEIMAEIPLNRYGEAEEVADAVAFLVSDRAGFITGASLQVDGGQIRSTL